MIGVLHAVVQTPVNSNASTSNAIIRLDFLSRARNANRLLSLDGIDFLLRVMALIVIGLVPKSGNGKFVMLASIAMMVTLLPLLHHTEAVFKTLVDMPAQPKRVTRVILRFV